MNQFQKILALTPYQWYLLISAMILLPYIRLSLNILGFKKTYNRIAGLNLNTQTSVQSSDHQQEAKNIAHMINVAATHGFYRANCLTRSLLLLRTLKKKNLACQLMIGVNQQGAIDINNIEAHAWVESEGIVLNDRSNISTCFKAFPLPKIV